MAGTAYCPNCRTVTNLSVSIKLRTLPAIEGKSETLISRTYHCQSCNLFVRGEDDEGIDIEEERKIERA